MRTTRRALAAVVTAAALGLTTLVAPAADGQTSRPVNQAKCDNYSGLAAHYRGLADKATDPKDRSYYSGLARDYEDLASRYC